MIRSSGSCIIVGLPSSFSIRYNWKTTIRQPLGVALFNDARFQQSKIQHINTGRHASHQYLPYLIVYSVLLTTVWRAGGFGSGCSVAATVNKERMEAWPCSLLSLITGLNPLLIRPIHHCLLVFFCFSHHSVVRALCVFIERRSCDCSGCQCLVIWLEYLLYFRLLGRRWVYINHRATVLVCYTQGYLS